MTHTTTDAAEARMIEAIASVVDKPGRRLFAEMIRAQGISHRDKFSGDEVLAAMRAFATAEAASGAGEREDALEAAARAMCDRVNGIGDYDENIGQRRTGWLAQAKAGIAAYLAALEAAPTIPATGHAATEGEGA